MCKNLFISIMKHGFFRTLQSANPKFIHQFHVFFPFMFHLTCISKPALFPQMIYLFWWSLYSVYFDLSTSVSSLPFWQSLLASCRSYLPCSTHTYTPFSNTIMNKMNKVQWLKSKNVYNVTDWWKLVKKGRMKWKKKWVVRLLTMEEAGSKRVLGQKNSCESEYWKYWRKLRFSGRRRSVLIASRTSPYS